MNTFLNLSNHFYFNYFWSFVLWFHYCYNFYFQTVVFKSTETIVAKTAKNFRLFQLQNFHEQEKDKEKKIKVCRHLSNIQYDYESNLCDSSWVSNTCFRNKNIRKTPTFD